MPPTRRQFGVTLAFGLLILLVAVNAGVTRAQLQEQIDKRRLVAHSQQVLLQISQSVSSLKDAESGQRGYLYTNDREYLEPYNEATSEVGSHMEQLLQLTREDAPQRALAEELRQLSRTRLAQLAETIALNESGQASKARALVMTDQGRDTMNQIRATADAMWDTESSEEGVRRAEYEQSTRHTILSIYGASAAAALALVLVAFYLLRNMRERERHAATLREREEWFRVTLSSIGDGVLATDANAKVTFINPVASTLIGTTVAESVNRKIEEVFPIFNENTHQPVANPVAIVLREGKVVGLANHTVLKNRDGRLIPIEDSAAPIRNDQQEIIGVVLVFRDATFERKSQDMMRRAEKLATAGRFAATMAHEINNPLEAVGNLLYIVKSADELRAENRDYLLEAEHQLERVSHLTRQTLGFYRESADPSEVSVPEVIESVLRFYDSNIVNKRIKVQLSFEECPRIQGLAGELRQMMANLISNALDALPDRGLLKVSTVPVANDGLSGVEIRVRDTGCGVPAENLQRIFEPFFTTKSDVGTGLGLWVAKQIAERHGGSVLVESRTDGPDRGTQFSIFLPERTGSLAQAVGLD
jgi:PAS domain S-box-containing protein